MLAFFRPFRSLRDVFDTPYQRLLKAYSAFVSADLRCEQHPDDPEAAAELERCRVLVKDAERENGIVSKATIEGGT